MNKNLKSLRDFLLNKGINEKELEPYLQLIEGNLKNKKYGLVWEEQEEHVFNELQHQFPVLKEIKKQEIISDPKNSMNLLIEGDNLESLYVLNYTHKGLIDLIYIDPPYNTGNKDFVYNDEFIDKEDNWRHSSWLSFMNKRLRLAKDLMSDSGVIFISIDDNEVSQLTLLCDEIFGEKNRFNPIIWLKGNAQNDSEYIQKNHEYILGYRKGKTNLKSISKIKRELFHDDYGYFVKSSGITTGGQGGTLNSRPNLGYTIYYNPKTNDKIAVCDYDVEKARTSNNEEEIYTTNENLIGDGYVAIRPNKKGTKLGCWTWSLSKFNDEKNLILITKNKNNYSVMKKRYVDIKESEIIKEKNKMYIEEINKVSPKSFVEFNSANGTKIITSMFKEKIFNNSKPLELIKYLIGLTENKDGIILDFFAGSGTTGQAVLELNNEDCGNRQFILCTHGKENEDSKINIAEEITYPRLRKVIDGYAISKGKEVEGVGGNLKYYKVTKETDVGDNDDNSFKLIDKCTEIISIKENCYQVIENHQDYDIVSNGDTVVLVYKNPMAMPHEINLVANKLSTYHDKKKILYTTNTDFVVDDIEVKEFPTEIIEKFKTLNLI